MLGGLFDFFPRLLSCCLKARVEARKRREREKLRLLFKQGTDRVRNYMDVRSLVKTSHKVALLSDLFFRKQGRQFLRLQRRNLLEFGGSDSKDSSSNSDPAVQQKYLQHLVGWTAKTPVEKKLVLGVLHRSGHKDFEEANEE